MPSLFDDTHLFVPLNVWLGAAYWAAFAGWPRETDGGAAAAAAELQMKQINGGNWVETLQISSKQFWESGDTEWRDGAALINAESLFTGSVKAIASRRVWHQFKRKRRGTPVFLLEDVSAWKARRVFVCRRDSAGFPGADGVSALRYVGALKSVSERSSSNFAN